jgi:hypothetical protein
MILAAAGAVWIAWALAMLARTDSDKLNEENCERCPHNGGAFSPLRS